MRAQTTPDRDADLRARALRELETRATPGSIGYLLAWFAVLLSQPDVRATAVGVAVTVVVVSLAAGRLVLSRRFDALVDADPALARRLLVGLVLGSALGAGVIGLLTLVWPPFEGARTLVLVVGGVITSVGSMALALEPTLRLGIPIAIVGPYAIGLAIAWSAADLGLALLLVLYVAYLARASKLVHDDWWRAAELSADQRERAAELERLSITDGLTLLTNRIAFDERLAAEWARAERSGSVLSVLLIDLDHFKAINDTYGHAAGDTCLVAVARAVEGRAERRSDVVARHGGEEFAVLLPETGGPAALAIAESMRAAVAALAIDVAGEPVPLSASIGVASAVPMRAPGDPQGLVDAADAALYDAKRTGRNCVQTAALPV